MSEDLIDRVVISEEVVEAWSRFCKIIIAYATRFLGATLADFGSERMELRQGIMCIIAEVRGEEFILVLQPNQWRMKVCSPKPSSN